MAYDGSTPVTPKATAAAAEGMASAAELDAAYAPGNPGLAGMVQFAVFYSENAEAINEAAATHAAEAATAEADAKETERLTNKYGLRPRRWVRFMDGQAAMSRALPKWAEHYAEHLTSVAASMDLPFAFTGYELATNFLAEGGFFGRQMDISPSDQGGWDAYEELGIDMIVDYLEELTPWMSAGLLGLVSDPANHRSRNNEQKQKVTYINPPNFGLAVESNAVMFAEARYAFYRDCRALSIPFKKLAADVMFFWTSLYFNMHHNRGGAKQRLEQYGATWARVPFHGEDDHYENSGSPKFNATWRTATYQSQTNRDAYAKGLGE